jgi:hypothetical protein
MADDPTLGQPDTPETRMARALHYAGEYGYIDGAHHKQWIIDQMCRALTGCPMETIRAIDVRGTAYSYEAQGESDAYREFLGGDYDPEEWQGIAP